MTHAPAVLDGVADALNEVDDGAGAERAIHDEAVEAGGEHGLVRVDAVGEQHEEALRLQPPRAALVAAGELHVCHLQHREDGAGPVGVLR